MRVTFNMQGMQMHKMLSTSLSNVMELNKKVAMNQTLVNPWDNTTNYVSAYGVQNMINELTQFGENANNASNWLNNADNELKSLVEALKKARDDYAIAGASDTYDEESRRALAQDVQSLYNQIMDIANANYNGRYIFGGHETGKPPFSGGGSSVSNVITKNSNGESVSGDAIIKSVYSDMSELKSGKYRTEITVTNGIAKLTLYDEKGNVMLLDSNGSDEAGGKGNNTATSMTFPYEPGKVINTGRGISFKMPEDLDTDTLTSITMEFNYKSGSEITYQGDNGFINSQIGYNQDIPINMPGSNIFSQSSQVLQGSRPLTVNGLPATSNTPFGKLDGINLGNGDSIKVSGTDHNGNKIGTANVMSPSNPQLDLSSASEKERTLNVTYGDKIYKVVVPQKAYGSADELANAINYELKNAEYVGSLGDLDGKDATIDGYGSLVDSSIKSGNYDGEINNNDKNKFKVDLSSQIKVTADGDRLSFTSQKTGDNVRMAITGNDQSLLGFKNQTIAAAGKDTTFELGHDFHSDTIKPIQTTHEGVDLTGEKYTVYVNGKEITINKPTTQINTTNMANVKFGQEDVILNINGRDLTIKADDFNRAPNKEQFLKDTFEKAGLNGEAAIANFVDNGDGTYNFDLSVASPSKKELEFAFDQALRQAGFDFGVGVRLSSSSDDPADLGKFDVTFSLSNYNAEKDSALTTTFYDNTTIPPTSDMQTASVDKSTMNPYKEKTIGDYIKFIEDLYGETVDVSLVNGKLTVADLRGGDSKLTFRTNAQNQGVGHPSDNMNVMGGSYNGHKDDNWTVTVKTTLGLNNQRNVSIQILDKNGNLLYDDVTPDYKGGPIQLPNGVTITPNDMNLPDPNDPTKREEEQKFQVELKAEPNLSFGDMNIIETGKNVNIFRSIDNLIHALEHNITKNGFGTPSSWKATDLNSTAKPYLGGTFQGNFNDDWKYEIMGQGDKTNFYLQNEYKTTSGAIRFDPAMGVDTPLKFGVDIYDNKTGKTKRVDVNIDLSKANPPITDEKSAQEYILKELNNNKDFVDAGVRFTSKDGHIEIQSGSGTKIASFANTATDPNERAYAQYIMGFDTMANGKLDEEITVTGSFTFNVTDPFGNPKTKTITITATAGTTFKQADLLEEINNQLNAASPAGTDGRIKATIGANGGIVFSDTKTDDPVEASVLQGGYNPLKIGLTHDAGGNLSKIGISGVQVPKTDLSEADEAARTLTVKYLEGTPPTQKEVKLLLDKKEYSSAQEMADALNEQLAEKGINAAQLSVGVNAKGELAFMQGNDDFGSVMVEGDYAGTLGFPKAGDSVSVKVTNADGELVQNVDLDTANKTVYVSDGLQLGFNAGSLAATDSFTAAIGSGLDGELDTLNAAIDQVLSAATILGTRGQRVDSVIKFQETVIASNESIKAGYLGSRPEDVLKLTTEVKMATTAYEAAMSLTNTILNLSILNYLR